MFYLPSLDGDLIPVGKFTMSQKSSTNFAFYNAIVMADVGKPSYAFSVLYCLKMLRSQKSNRAVMSVPQVVDSETCFAVTC